MNKKIIIPLIVILVAAGLVFLVTVRTSKPDQPLEETLSVLKDEIRLIHEAAWGGKISQEETNERFTVLESKVTNLIKQHGLQAEVNEFVSQRKTAEELAKQAELQVMTIELQLAGIAETNAELVTPLMQELSAIRNKIYQGQVSQKEAEEKLAALEDKITELIAQHGIEVEAAKFVDRYEASKELIQQFEFRIRNIELQLGSVAEYLIQKYRTDTVKEVVQARALQNELIDLSDDIWEGKAGQEEIDEKLSALENKAAELIAQYGIQAEVEEYAAKTEAALDRVTAISQRISTIQLQLTALELYLSER